MTTGETIDRMIRELDGFSLDEYVAVVHALSMKLVGKLPELLVVTLSTVEASGS